MADSQITTGEEVTAPSVVDVFEREYFTYPGIFSLMANSVMKHDPKLFVSCADAIDMTHVSTLKGLGYLGQLLAEDEGGIGLQRKFAGEAIAEMTSLMAELVEMQNMAEIIKSSSATNNG